MRREILDEFGSIFDATASVMKAILMWCGYDCVFVIQVWKIVRLVCQQDLRLGDQGIHPTQPGPRPKLLYAF